MIQSTEFQSMSAMIPSSVALHPEISQFLQSQEADRYILRAAQFMEIEIEYGNDEDLALQKRERSKDGLPATIADFRLKDIADLGAKGIRGMRTETSPTRPVKRRARILADEDAELSDDNAIQLDERPYADALNGTSWADYNDCLRYLDDEARGGY